MTVKPASVDLLPGILNRRYVAATNFASPKKQQDKFWLMLACTPVPVSSYYFTKITAELACEGNMSRITKGQVDPLVVY